MLWPHLTTIRFIVIHPFFQLPGVGSILVYAFADLRTLASKGLLSEQHASMLSLPVDATKIIAVVNANLPLLHEKCGKDCTELYLSALASLQESFQKESSKVILGSMLHSSQLVAFDDKNSEQELVYGIAVNTVRKRITVGFRGSVTSTDFITDAKGLLTEIANPVVSGAGLPQTPTVGVHHGFRGT